MKPSLILTLLALTACPPSFAGDAPKPAAVALGASGLHLDDFYYDSNLKRVVVPAGRTGKLVLIDPETRAQESLEVFPEPKDGSPEAAGLTSADGGEGLIFALNRADQRVYVMDPAIKKVIAKATLAGAGDIARYVSATRELWVTEPKKNQIEVFSLSPSTAVRPIDPRQETVVVSSSPYEMLLIDLKRKLAYSNQEGSTVAIELQSKKIASTWKNGCKSATGLALDDERGYLLVGCREGRVSVLDLNNKGAQLSSLKGGDGVDIIAYSPSRQQVYVPGGKSGTFARASLSDKGELKALGKPLSVASGAHCVVADPLGGAWLCDGKSGSVLYYAPLDD